MFQKIVLLLFFIAPLLMPTTSFSADEKPQVILETNYGTITIELEPELAPKTVANFLNYVKSDHYENVIFHRVIKNFMIQGGGFTVDMKKKPVKAAIQNEADNGLHNKRGTIAMARTPDPHSAAAQFFINTVDNFFLDHKSKTSQGWGYCVFGRVVAGMDVVDAIGNISTGVQHGFSDVPTSPVIIKKASLVK